MANQVTVTTSKQFSLNIKDVLKGIVVAILTPVIVVIQSSLDAGSLSFNWQQIGMAAVAGFVAYLAKNFFTPAQTIVKKVNDDEVGGSGTEIPQQPPPVH